MSANDLKRPGVDRALVAAFERTTNARVRYHLRQAAQLQLVDAETADTTDPGEPVFDDRLPPLPTGADGDELDVIVDTDGTAVLYDPADNDAAIKSHDGIQWLGDWV